MSLLFIVITIIGSILASMGVGGGGIFIILTTMFLKADQKEMQFLNLIMFVTAGIIASISNVKNGDIFKDIFIKVTPLLLVGVFLGNLAVKKIDSEKLSIYFLIFMIAIGVYEIISSLIRIKNANNNKAK